MVVGSTGANGDATGATNLGVPVGLGDEELLERFEPIVCFNEGEYFLPASVEAYVAQTELWRRTGPSTRELVSPAGSLDLDRLVELTDGHVAQHFLRLVSEPLTRTELVGWQLQRDRPRFRAETRLGRVGVLTRLVDAAARTSLLARGRTPRGAQAAAALLDRSRSDHGDHPYYGRVVRSAGYTVLQYWFFYFFNDWRSRAHGVNDHEGDWEQVTVYLVEPGDGTIRPAWVAFSAHEEVGPDLRRRWDDPDLTVVDGHPVVHAGLGSHAGAVLSGEYLITVRTNRYARFTKWARRVSHYLQPWLRDRDERDGVGIPYVEYARGDGVSIGPGAQLPWRRQLVDDDTPWLRRYSGLWGDDTNDPFGGERGPAGPRYERDATVRQSWSDPVGWAALDGVAPNDATRRTVIADRIEQLDAELVEIAARRDERTLRLRAATIAATVDADDAAELAALAARATARRDELDWLTEALEHGEVEADPHDHLRHRVVPLPAESRERRRLLRVWATLSTPLVFVLLAVMFLPSGGSAVAVGVFGLVAVLGIESLTRRRLFEFAFRIAILVVAFSLGGGIVLGLITSWRLTCAAILLAAALAFLVLNLRELRRN